MILAFPAVGDPRRKRLARRCQLGHRLCQQFPGRRHRPRRRQGVSIGGDWPHVGRVGKGATAARRAAHRAPAVRPVAWSAAGGAVVRMAWPPAHQEHAGRLHSHMRTDHPTDRTRTAAPHFGHCGCHLTQGRVARVRRDRSKAASAARRMAAATMGLCRSQRHAVAGWMPATTAAWRMVATPARASTRLATMSRRDGQGS